MIRALSLAMTLTCATPALADSCAGIEDLLHFIATETGYGPAPDCPPVLRSTLLDGSASLRSQVGAYVPATGQILLAPTLDVDSAVGRSYLLHELVHAAQHQTGADATVRCEAELEQEAYLLQTRWLRQMGETREALLISWVADALGHCAGDRSMLDY